MASTLYSPLGAANGASMTAPQARAQLRAMKQSLEKYLRIRARMDDYAEGKRPPGMLRRPGTVPVPPGQAKRQFSSAMRPYEAQLADSLFKLLVASGSNPNTLPAANVTHNPDAAAQLAAIALEAPIEGEVGSPQAQGIIWLAAIPVVAVVIGYAIKVKSDADLAAKKAELECIKAGACTDSGFWLKVASVAVIGWLVWDKAGVGDAVRRRAAKL